LVEARGIEPLSENLFTRLSTGVVIILHSLKITSNDRLYFLVAS